MKTGEVGESLLVGESLHQPRPSAPYPTPT